MDDDDRRSIWIEVRGKRWEWYRLTTATYNDCHYVYLTGDEYDHHAICDKDNENSHRCLCLSHYRKCGLIKRSILNSLIPDDSYDRIDIPRVIKLYENPSEPTQFTEMTLRKYMHYWRIAYEAVYDEQQGEDIEVFRHSSKGYVVKDYDIDSEAAFKEWKKIEKVIPID